MINRSLMLTLAAGLLVMGLPGKQAHAQAIEAAPELPAQEECRLSLQAPGELAWRGPFSRGYDPGHSGVHGERVSLDIRQEGGPCEYSIEVAPVGDAFHLQSSRDALRFSLRSDERAPASSVSAPLVITSRAGVAGGAWPATFLIEIDPGQFVNAGRYSQDLEIRVYRMSDAATFLSDVRRLTIFAEVWPEISASIGASALAGRNSAEVNLEAIEPGTQADLDFSVRSNTPYEIRIDSEHRGNLKHARSQALLPYELLLDGRPVSASGAGSAAIVSSGYASRSHDLRLKISETAGVPAGRYADRLTVIISAD